MSGPEAVKGSWDYVRILEFFESTFSFDRIQ